MAIISAVKMLALVGNLNLYSFYTDPEMNAQPVPVIFFWCIWVDKVEVMKIWVYDIVEIWGNNGMRDGVFVEIW